ncbi:cysteine desulfurase [Eupransor demetentiae]|uniref:cysteine desulfurase n=1 Tax=Eupransor demetentiae TaxID=3109584 RepID=A0ABM9N310_9LACO|nr:Selenocysteine lyase/Cysteine desulfurase (CsdA) [Lactobacillaceae bacterium LMG 33000]
MKSNREEFPILQEKINGQPMVYLDSAATSQKPKAVLESLKAYYEQDNANVHRGLYTLSMRATDAYEAARDKVKGFLNAAERETILFTRGTTESLNWVAQSYGGSHLQPGDEIVLTYAEHHSNLVPWQIVAKQTGAKLRYADLTEKGQVDLVKLAELLNEKTKIVAINHVSNVLGTVNPIQEVTALAHEVGAVVVVDGAQAAPHIPLDVQALDADFYAFSGHKMLGPTGIGVLYGKRELLEEMPPAQYGGEMIEAVGLYESTFQPLPELFEAGTPNIAGAIGLGAAIDYLQDYGFDRLQKEMGTLIEAAQKGLSKIEGLTIYGPTNPAERVGVLSFNLTGVHPHDLSTVLDQYGVEVRAGHHCAQPLMQYLDVSATVRASFYLYNDMEDVQRLIAAVQAAKEFFNDDNSRT